MEHEWSPRVGFQCLLPSPADAESLPVEIPRVYCLNVEPVTVTLWLRETNSLQALLSVSWLLTYHHCCRHHCCHHYLVMYTVLIVFLRCLYDWLLGMTYCPTVEISWRSKFSACLQQACFPEPAHDDTCWNISAGALQEHAHCPAIGGHGAQWAHCCPHWK